MRNRAPGVLLLLLLCACGGREGSVPTLTVSGSAVGAEGEVLSRQIRRFMAENPGLRVTVQRTPDDATQRHQLYVQWLNAHVGTPDIALFRGQYQVPWGQILAAAVVATAPVAALVFAFRRRIVQGLTAGAVKG